MNTTQSQYEKFQQWLNDCPVKVLDYQDFTDQFQITFEVELEEVVDKDPLEITPFQEELEVKKYIQDNPITPEEVTRTQLKSIKGNLL